MEIRDILPVMVEKGASDLYLTVGLPPMYRIGGVVQPIGDRKFTPADLEALAESNMNEKQWGEFQLQMEIDLALSIPNLSRFRLNVFRQRGSVGMVIRRVAFGVGSLDELRLPPILKDVSLTKRGLVLVVGSTGSGKSTTLAAMIDHRNANAADHIISIEDPIEFVHRHKKSIITQREVGFDTHSFHEGLKRAMRQAPDVILIGEIRDTETMEAAITFADTGHLCLGTLHSTNANQCIERILNFFSVDSSPKILMQLSMILRAIISQRLIPTVDGNRVPAVEILLDTPRIKDLIRKGGIDTLKEAIGQGAQEGCQTFDHALFSLYKEGKISMEQALANADSANDLRLKIKNHGLKGVDGINKPLGKDEEEKGKGFHIRGLQPTGSPLRKI